MTMTGGTGTGTELPVGFKRHLRVEAVDGDAVYLLSDQGTTALQGHEVQELAALLDGTRTLTGVLADAAAAMPPATAARMIAELARAELIGYHDPAADACTEAYWEYAGCRRSQRLRVVPYDAGGAGGHRPGGPRGGQG